jgi:hypothetical protein
MKEIKIFLFAAAAVAFTSCNDFLDATPDSRIDVNTESEIKAMLTSAYPSATYVRVTELASDNADDLNGTLNGNYDRFSEQCYRWQDITESDNENTAEIWQDYYAAIAAANHASGCDGQDWRRHYRQSQGTQGRSVALQSIRSLRAHQHLLPELFEAAQQHRPRHSLHHDT